MSFVPFEYQSSKFLIKFSQENPIKIHFTDLKNLWIEKIELEDLIERFKNLNPTYAGNNEEILEEIIKVTKKIETITKLEEIGNMYHIQLKLKVDDLPIKMDYELFKVDQQIFYKEVTLPLVKTVQFLELKKDKLAELLIKKDKEILQYNCQYGDISQKFKVTEKFSDDAVHSVNGLLLNVFNKQEVQHEFPELKTERASKRKLKLPTALKKRMS